MTEYAIALPEGVIAAEEDKMRNEPSSGFALKDSEAARRRLRFAFTFTAQHYCTLSKTLSTIENRDWNSDFITQHIQISEITDLRPALFVLPINVSTHLLQTFTEVSLSKQRLKR